MNLERDQEMGKTTHGRGRRGGGYRRHVAWKQSDIQGDRDGPTGEGVGEDKQGHSKCVKMLWLCPVSCNLKRSKKSFKKVKRKGSGPSGFAAFNQTRLVILPSWSIVTPKQKHSEEFFCSNNQNHFLRRVKLRRSFRSVDEKVFHPFTRENQWKAYWQNSHLPPLGQKHLVSLA